MVLTCRKMAVCRPGLVSIQGEASPRHTKKWCTFILCYCCVAVTVILYYVFVNLRMKPMALHFLLLRLIACFCSSGLLSCSQIRWGDLSKCCRVLQLWECHLITRAHCVTPCCVPEKLALCLFSIDCWLQNFNSFQSPVLQPVAPLYFLYPVFYSHAPPVARMGLVKTDAYLFSKPWNTYTWDPFCFLHFIPTACRTA